ncbi:MAG: hypothetical protein LBJ91_02110 [Clostridiales Family XIII bacterium]|jgi:hypothetical protein|nr:hypothetical protein [Clostridiales Family XIII bacterium]
MTAAPFDVLKRKYDAGVLPHALLVSGGAERSRLGFARDVAVMLFGGDDPVGAASMIDDGNCADLIRVSPDNGSIKVGAVRELTEKIKLKPFSSDRILAVIESSELMNAQAQNKLLKTLEEPPGNDVIMLLAGGTGMLRSTIVSRCMKINLGAEAVSVDPQVKGDAVRALSAALFGKPMHEAFAILDSHTDDPFPLLDAMELFLRNLVVGGREAGLVSDGNDRAIAQKMKDGSPGALTAGIRIVEDTRMLLRFGRVNRKNGLRDMALRLRTGGN